MIDGCSFYIDDRACDCWRTNELACEIRGSLPPAFALRNGLGE